MQHIILICIAIILCPAVHAAALPEDNSKAVILAYHRVGEDAYPDSNLRLSQFIEHVREIEHGGYTVLPLEQILSAIQNEHNLPPKTIAITFEGAYKSSYINAIPLLTEKNIPFTVFYAADAVEQNLIGYMNWQELKELHQNQKSTLATLPASYSRITNLDETQLLKTINKARRLHREKLSEEAPYFAYPFGEYTKELKPLIRQQGYKAAFGLHSGPAHSSSDIYALPRFSMTDNYGDIDRFRLVTNTLPLAVTELEPANPVFEDTLNIGFTLPPALSEKAKKLSCFLSGHAKPHIEKLGTRIEIRSQEKILSNKMRLNCTLSEGENQWRWLGLLFHRNLTPEQVEPQQPQE